MTEAIKDSTTETSTEEVSLDGYMNYLSVPELPNDSTVSPVIGEMKSIGCRVDAPIEEVLLRLDVSTIELQRRIREFNEKCSAYLADSRDA